MFKQLIVLSVLCSLAICAPTDCSQAKPAYDACKDKHNELIADPSDAHRFYQCENGLVVGHAIECPVSGNDRMTFDVKAGNCVVAEAKECQTENETFADPAATNKYFICHSGKKVEQTCYPDYLYYDVDQHTCMK